MNGWMDVKIISLLHSLFCFADIVELVSENQNPSFRPRLENVECDVRYSKLMQMCWDENPMQRPTFDIIKAKIRQMHGGR